MGTIASHYVYLLVTLLHSLHHSEKGDTPEHLKVFFLPEMATIIASALFLQIFSVKNAVSMTHDTLQQHWWRTIEFLTLVGQAGIVLNPDKFQFAKRSVDFASFRMSESAVEPLPKYLNANKNFLLKSSQIFKVGLVHQVANYVQLRDILAPFKPFLSPKRKFQ